MSSPTITTKLLRVGLKCFACGDETVRCPSTVQGWTLSHWRPSIVWAEIMVNGVRRLWRSS